MERRTRAYASSRLEPKKRCSVQRVHGSRVARPGRESAQNPSADHSCYSFAHEHCDHTPRSRPAGKAIGVFHHPVEQPRRTGCGRGGGTRGQHFSGRLWNRQFHRSHIRLLRMKSAAVAALVFLFVAQCSLAQAGAVDEPEANPGRPTVSTPATTTPVGYLQFETGFLGAWHSPEFSSRQSVNEVLKFAVSRRFEFLTAAEPFVHYQQSGGQPKNGTGEVFLGVQGIVHQGEGAHPTIAVSYFRRIYDGGAPELDLGSARNAVLLLASADVKGFHYDANVFFNEVIDSGVHRAQFGQTLSISHSLGHRLTLSGELWHFTQPFLMNHAVGNLWALGYAARKNLVLDGGFNRGLTSTSTRWEVFVGFTYLLPHRLLRE